MNSKRTFRLALAMVTALTSIAALANQDQRTPAALGAADSSALRQQFQDPPNSARPRVWWHWMNGNITKDGIEKDMEWMKRIGIGGLQNFDANLKTPQIVKKRLVYMTPAWKDAFKFAATEADKLGLELAIASSPGWSETGGPWVTPRDGLKKLVWSKTDVVGGKHFSGKLPAPPSVTGPYQDIPMNSSISAMLSGLKEKQPPRYYADIAVLAIPVSSEDAPVVLPKVSLVGGSSLPAAKLFDSDLTSGVEIPHGTKANPSIILLTYERPQTIRSASIFIPRAKFITAGATVAPVLEATRNGVEWQRVADLPVSDVPTTVSFAPVTARQFRVVFHPVLPSVAGLAKPMPGVAMDFSRVFAARMTSPFQLHQLRLSSEARVDRFETKAGFDLVVDYYALSKGVGNAAGVDPHRVIDLTSRMKPDGTLDWTPPKGKWRIIRLGYSLLGTTNHPATAEATGLEVDKFDGDAVRRYMEHYLGMYRDTVGSGLMGAHGVRALLTDSIEVGAANWTPKMIADFKRLRGYDPTPWLPALTGTIIGSRAQSDKFLYDFRRTLADLMASQHYGTVAEVAHEHGLKVYGEALEDHRPSLGDDMAMRSHTDIPMSAMWAFSLKQGPRPTYLADDKGASSVAHIYGQNLAAAESMTSMMAPWAYGPAELRHIIDLEFALGINRPVIHTSVHVPVDDKKPGLSLFIYGQYFNRNESWAPLARPWVDYIARNSLLLQQGRNVADVGYFYGEEAPLTALYGDHPVADAPKTSAFDFVNDDALLHLLSNDGNELITPGGARYRALYLGGSSNEMTLPTLRKIADLVEGGATVVGMAPKGDPSLDDDPVQFSALVHKLWPGGGMAEVGKGRVIASTDIEAALRRIGVAPDFRYTGGEADSDIPFVHRKLVGGDLYFLLNRKDRPETIEAHFRVTGKAPELWHADTGKSEPVSYRIKNGETVVPLTLRAEESEFVMFRKPAAAASLTVERPKQVELARLDGPWTVRFQAGRGAPASAIFSRLTPLDENADPDIKYFSGVATYVKDFAAPRGWRPGRPLILDMGEVHEIGEVWVNGKKAGYTWHAPYRVDIGAEVKPGRNHLEIRVANLWINRLIGDQQPDAKKITWTALPTYTANAPLRRSGLIGPVTLSTLHGGNVTR